MHTTSARRARLLTGLIAGAALVLAAPLAASAHVHVTPDEAETGTATRLDFSFSHACEKSPTTALTITIPDGIDGVTPVVDGAWTISREVGSDGIPTQVTYTAVTPIEDATAASVSLDVIFASGAKGNSVPFPVLQSCVVGEHDWAQIAEDGQDSHDLDSPAPVVSVGGASAGAGHGSEHSDASDSDSDADHADAEHADAEATTTSSDPLALWLSGGALAAALAALIVAVTRRRTTR